MPKITIELDDDLEERVESAIEEAKEALINYLDQYPNEDMPDSLDDFCDPHDIVDSATPIYTRDIETAWFLHGNELERAYEDSGLGNNPRENDGQTAIYAYIVQELGDWFYREAERVYEDWKEGFICRLQEEVNTRFPKGTAVRTLDKIAVIDSIEVTDIENIWVTATYMGEEDPEEFIITDLDDLEEIKDS